MLWYMPVLLQYLYPLLAASTCDGDSHTWIPFDWGTDVAVHCVAYVIVASGSRLWMLFQSNHWSIAEVR